MLSQSITTAAAAALASQTATAAEPDRPDDEPFGYCLNTSTIRGQKLPLAEEIDIAARAGYQGIEPWVAEIDAYEQAGGTRADLRKRIADHGTVGRERDRLFADGSSTTTPSGPTAWKKPAASWTWPREIGGKRIAAPPPRASATRTSPTCPRSPAATARCSNWASKHGVVPVLELWGFARVLNKLSDVAYRRHRRRPSRRPAILADCYHLYKGGSTTTACG